MGEWSDMEYDMGFLDYKGNLLIDEYNDEYNEENNHSSELTNEESIEIFLTPTKYLNSDEKYMKLLLLNNKIDKSKIILELMHDKTNNYDSLALSVYCNKIMIGYIRKDEIGKINKFCFNNRDIISDLGIKWEKDKFILSKRSPYSKKTILDNSSERILNEKIEILNKDIKTLNEKMKKKEEILLITENDLKEVTEKLQKEIDTEEYISNIQEKTLKKLRIDKQKLFYDNFSYMYNTLVIEIGSQESINYFDISTKTLSINTICDNLYFNTVLIGKDSGFYPSEKSKFPIEHSKRIMLKNINEIEKLLKNVQKTIYFIIKLADTDSGMASIIAKIAKDLNLNIIAIVLEPFTFQGKRSMKFAEESLKELKIHCTSIFSFNSDMFYIEYILSNPEYKNISLKKIDKIISDKILTLTKQIFRDTENNQQSGTSIEYSSDYITVVK